MDKKEHKNTQPFIVACGETQDEIKSYIIYVDNDPIYVSCNIYCKIIFIIYESHIIINLFIYLQVPDEFAFQQVIDLYFKLHHVFEIKFDDRLKNTFDFIQYYLYGLKKRACNPTTKMIELHHRLNLAIDIQNQFGDLQI